MNTPMNDDANKLFVAGLAEGVTDTMLRELFSEAGIAVLDVSLPRDRMTGRPRGFAFIRLNGPDDVDRALGQLNGHILGGASISVRRFNAEPPARGERTEGGRPGPRGPAVDTSDRTLYVGNLPYDATQEELEGALRGAGADSFTRVHLPIDADGRRRGFGFVTMATPDAAKGAVDQLRGALLRGRPLVVNLAAPKGTTTGPRPERSFGGPPGPGGPPAAGGTDPRNASRFGPPAKPGGAKTDYSRKKKTDGEGARPARSKRDHEARWSNHDDD
jgi:RNA recognition motif-containing protein